MAFHFICGRFLSSVGCGILNVLIKRLRDLCNPEMDVVKDSGQVEVEEPLTVGKNEPR